MTPRVSQAEQDGRKLDDIVQHCRSLNDVGRVLMGSNISDKDVRPAGQFLNTEVRQALEWRSSHLGCPDSLRLLGRLS